MIAVLTQAFLASTISRWLQDVVQDAFCRGARGVEVSRCARQSLRVADGHGEESRS